jgi:hypothetical protein
MIEDDAPPSDSRQMSASDQLNAGPPSKREEVTESRALLRLETRLSQAEAQIKALQEGVGELNAYARSARQRALYLRIGVLIALLAAFFFMQYAR